jgi:RNA polymerase sigma-70 factor (ECF subfamily)
MALADSVSFLTPGMCAPRLRFPGELTFWKLLAPWALATNKASAPPSNPSTQPTDSSVDKGVSGEKPSGGEEEPPAPKEPVESDDEKELVRRWVGRAKKGDREAYRQLVVRYQKRVFGILFGMLHSREDAMELTQDVFIKVYQRIKDFEEKSSFYTWVYRIAFNLAIDFRRREWKKVHTEYDDAVEQEGVDDAILNRDRPNPEAAMQASELGEQIRRALETLPDEQKQVLLLREVEGLSYQEMAESMGCSIGTIMSRLFYARKKMQAQLKTIYSGSGKWAPKEGEEPPEADEEEGEKKS